MTLDPDPLYVEPDPDPPDRGIGAWFAVVVIALAVIVMLLLAAPWSASAASPAVVNVTTSEGPSPTSSMPATISALLSGTASHVGRQFGSRYLALPEHRWGHPGRRVRICGDDGCVVRTSTDAGPDKAMQRAGRVADLNAWDFETVCGCPISVGLTTITVEYLGDATPLPATDTR